MNIQIEHLENHTARLTVEVPADRYERAKQKAAKKIAREANIPGFRKGKAPYNVVARRYGEAVIIEEALEDLTQEMYREALEQSGVEPYGPGRLEDMKIEETPVFVYTVPKEPVVDLNDYRSLRLDYVVPEITEADIDRKLDELRREKAEYIDREEGAQLDDSLVLDVHGFIETEDEDESDDDPHHDESVEKSGIDDPAHQRGKTIAHEHDIEVVLAEGDREPFGPGFSSALVGVKAGETVEFDILYPEDEEINPDLRGKSVHFVVEVKKVRQVIMPELNDEFAHSLTDRYLDRLEELSTAEGGEAEAVAPADSPENEETPAGEENATGEDEAGEPLAPERALTLDQLRQSIRLELEDEARNSSKERYASDFLDQILAKATLSYPEDAIEDEVSDMVRELEERMKQQGISMEMFTSVTGKSLDEIRADYRTTAEDRLKRRLVLGHVVRQEEIRVTAAEFQAHIDSMIANMGVPAENYEAIRNMLVSDQFSNTIIQRMLQNRLNERLIAIGTGNAPQLPADDASDATNTEAGKETEAEAVSIDSSTDTEDPIAGEKQE